MSLRKLLIVSSLVLCALAAAGCGGGERPRDANSANANSSAADEAAAREAARSTPKALPDNGFKAEITLADPPAKLRAGQKETVQVKVKNASDVQWYARGAEFNTSSDNKFYLAAGNRWLKAENNEKVTDMDGRYGLPKDLAPGEEAEVPLQITAPKTPGEYILEVDIIQEQVGWFLDKGSPTAKVKVTVVR
ncbi:MAG TPA: hypothetical protein VFS10_00255 [Pyrinomonadaceae bacterium]|nr:hypothetical protein [Pyrinomonadaceae bacterium]